MKDSEIVKAFLYSPMNLDMVFDCHCGKKLKMKSDGSSGNYGDGHAICENGHILLIGWSFISKAPSYVDRIIPPQVIPFSIELCKICKKEIGENWDWARDLDSQPYHNACANETLLVIQKGIWKLPKKKELKK